MVNRVGNKTISKMKKLRKIFTCMLIVQVMMAMSAGGVVWGQNTLRNVDEATKAMRVIGTVAPITEFKDEINNLAVDDNQYCIDKNSSSQVVVAALVRPGDYSRYWRNRNVTSDSRYTWVFVPRNFMQVVADKNIATSNTTSSKLSGRLCKLLGLQKEVRDTIIYMTVPLRSVFRPAYNPSITTIVTAANVGKKDEIEKLPIADRNWMGQQQDGNNLPWTRMGYTFDWGGDNSGNWESNKNYIGVSEFVLRPGTPYQDLGFVETAKISTDKTWEYLSK
jgi:hypothetical protein